jgi:hypothetical protein
MQHDDFGCHVPNSYVYMACACRPPVQHFLLMDSAHDVTGVQGPPDPQAGSKAVQDVQQCAHDWTACLTALGSRCRC